MIFTDIQKDCNILINRAFAGKTLSAFGVDGNGLYGANYLAKHFDVVLVDGMTQPNADKYKHICWVVLKDYNQADYGGHICTDNNLKISINAQLSAEGISTTCWTWADVGSQDNDSFAIIFDVEELLQWP